MMGKRQKGDRDNPNRDAAIIAGAASMSQLALAPQYGLSRSRVGAILRRAGIRKPKINATGGLPRMGS